ncbi:MAG: hypothetical protein EOO05_13470 [Chitinophagaceae bacterium]|nr:MAG: hypothetical protein EOO05_13470 [Chitinophagaceae bacterium]
MNLFRKLLICSLATGFTFTAASAQDTDSTGLPGDQFSLSAALDLFRKASSPEDFEKLLNTEGNDANNLDLNEDGQTDYVKVIDKKDGDVHVFVLQVAVSETEDQDIAVIEVEKTGESTAVLQIVGDEDIYGEETIVEPSEGESTSFLNTGSRYQHGPSFTESDGILVNVWLWPSVRYVYAPAYVVWHSPFRWRAHPVWWKPWRPVSHVVFYPRRGVYRPRYAVVTTRRVVRARAFYRPARVTSVTVVHRNQANVVRYRSNRSVQRTTVTGPNGHVKKTTTTVTGPRGNKVKKTKVRRNR